MASNVITAISQQTKERGRRNVFLDGKFAFALDLETLVKSKIRVGDTLSCEDISYLKLEGEIALAKEYGFKLLSARRYTNRDFRKKLSDKEYSIEAIDAVCSKMADFGYIDDEAYAEMYVRDKAKLLGKGERLIRTELMQKGISREILDRVFENFSNPEGLKKLLDKKLKGKSIDRKTLQSAFASAMRKGYGAEEIRAAIKTYTDEDFTHE